LAEMGTADADLAYLKKENVYAHLGKVIDRVVAEKPKDACGLVEVLSTFVKEQSILAKVPDSATLQSEEIATRVKALKQLDQAPAEEGAPIQVCAIPDFTEDAEMLSWAGVGLGQAESFQVMCSLRNLAAKEKDGLNKLRFWGKVLGTEADYYVAEAQRDGGGDEPDPDADQPGQGANQFTYYVTNDLAGEWRKLPDIKPNQIVAARAIKRLLTGNAGSKVITHPFFDGKEEVYLRAQIARIAADTVLCPKGFLKKEDEESPVEQNEEFVCPPSSELQKKEAWTHMQPHLLLSGRTVHPEIPEGDTPEEIALADKMREEQAADPVPEIIRGLHEDHLQWSIKQAGDPTMYRSVPDPAAPLRSSAVVYVRSLSWPGAVCAIRNGQFVNIYVGYGLGAVSSNFFPMAPPDVQDEPEDPGEVEEPQGSLEEPPAPEE